MSGTVLEEIITFGLRIWNISVADITQRNIQGDSA